MPGDQQGSDIDSDLEQVRALLADYPARALERVGPLLDHPERQSRLMATLLAGLANRALNLHEEAVRLLGIACDEADVLFQLPVAVEANMALGRSLRHLGDYDGALERINRSYELADAIDDPQGVVDALNVQASIINSQGQHQRALDMLNRARRKAVSAGLGSAQLAIIGTNIGEIYRSMGNYADALESLKEAYDHFKDDGVRGRPANANLISLGILYRRLGKIHEAERFYEEARESALATGDTQVVAAALNNLAGLALDRDDLDGAEALFVEALTMTRASGVPRYQSDNLDGLGKVHLARERLPEAMEAFGQAMEIAASIGYRDGELEAGINLARTQLASGNARLAVETLTASVALAAELGDRDHEINAYEMLSLAHERLEEYREALEFARRHHELENIVYNEQSEERTRQLTVRFELERSNHQAEMYRLRSTYHQQAHEEAEATVLARTHELEEAQHEIVTRLAVAAEYRDDDTGSHTRRVGRNAAAIAYAMGFPERDVHVLYTAARLHDVGKIGIPDSVLLKTDRLTADEMELMRRHTVIGARILSSGKSRILLLAENISLSHHERYDGRGYPQQLKGEAIPMASRIVAVSDVLDALTHARPYKPAWPVTEALSEIASQSGRQFDADVVEACLLVFRGPGSLSPTDDTRDWNTLLAQLQELGVKRGFPAVRRSSLW